MVVANSESCATTSCYTWKFAVALLLLRLCLGAHFFSEGTKKLAFDEVSQEWSLSPEFTAKTEIIFRNATGPMAEVFQDLLPGFYDWENLLAVPTQALNRLARKKFSNAKTGTPSMQLDGRKRKKTSSPFLSSSPNTLLTKLGARRSSRA